MRVCDCIGKAPIPYVYRYERTYVYAWVHSNVRGCAKMFQGSMQVRVCVCTGVRACMRVRRERRKRDHCITRCVYLCMYVCMTPFGSVHALCIY